MERRPLIRRSRSGFARLLLASGLAVAVIAASPAWAGPETDRPLAQAPACRPGARCCRDPDGRPVPPGTVIGPYICRPDGTWGPRPR